ncbi:hypothetical protein [Nitratifractor sp.]
MRKFLWNLGVAGVVLLSGTLYAEEIPIARVNSFLQEGGDLRMRSMRILQEYAMVASNNHFRKPEKLLSEDMDRLERGLKKLLESLKSEEEKETFQAARLRDAQKSLQAAQTILKTPPSTEKALEFWKAMDAVREGLNRSLTHLSQEVYPDEETVQGIMYANRLATISQRYGALYLYRVLGKGEALRAKKQLAFLSRFFPHAISQVRESAEALPETKRKEVEKALKNVEKNLNFFYIMGKSSRHFIPTLIYEKSDNMSKKAEEIVTLFFQSPTDGQP